MAEYLIKELNTGSIIRDHVPISDAMRQFVSSCPREIKAKLLQNIRKIWQGRYSNNGIGQLFTLIWDALVQLFMDSDDPVNKCLSNICSGPIDLSDLEINRLSFSSEARPANIENASFSGSVMLSVDFSNANARQTNFSGAFLDGVSFSEAILDNAIFKSAVVVDTDFSGASIDSADFSNISRDEISILVDSIDSSRGKIRLEGLDALGYLGFNGAAIEKIPNYFELRHHPRFAIVEKIIEKLKENTVRQRRGLEQRGAARQDINFSRKFMRHIEDSGLIRTPKNRKDVVEVTEKGRDVFGGFIEQQDIPEEISQFLRNIIP